MDTSRFKPVISTRRLVAFFCLVGVLLAALVPASPGLLWAILVPLLLFVVGVVIVSTIRQWEESGPPRFAYLSVIASRAPPLVQPLI